jgi:serine/threonine protein kinase
MIDYIGAYRVERELGEGGFGIVYQAYQSFLDRKVAIKTLHTDLTANPQIEQQFMHEARTIARLRHPGIVSVYEFGTLPTQPNPQTYMVMEYLPGETLEQRLKRKRLSILETAATIEALGQALDYAHSHNIIHRDLKPSNIIFSENDEPVIVDFGQCEHC